MARPNGHKDNAYLVKMIAQHEITTLHFVPSMLRVFLEDPGLGPCRSLQRVICSGEALPLEVQQLFFDRLGAALHNLYGPTEASVNVTYWPCVRDSELRTVPIGRPISNIQTYVLDRHLNPVSVGVPGELYLGGVGLGRGYLRRLGTHCLKINCESIRRTGNALVQNRRPRAPSALPAILSSWASWTIRS